MSGLKITNFFKRIPSTTNKDTSATVSDENNPSVANTECSPKRSKLETDGPDVKPNKVLLSPEQKCKIAENKAKAKQKQSDKEMEIIKANIGSTWFSALESEFSSPYFRELCSYLASERAKATVYPAQEDVWSWTTRTHIQDVKVVILGQDPYHGPGQAHGLCFSVKPPVQPPPSLKNIFKELESDIPEFSRPDHGFLVGWADQGVLMLNAVLTVRKGEANAHKDKGWERLTDAVIKWISTNNEGVVFLLWGASAHKKASHVDSSKHHLLKSTHPSPLSAHRGFLGCKHFSKCNELLVADGKTPIAWSHLPRSA